MRLDLSASRRAAVLFAASFAVRPPANALTSEEYDAGMRAAGGRGANALLKTRAESGVVRTGLIEDPLFKSGTIFDQLKNADGSATDVTFVFPKSWVFSRGPNLDVRDVQTSDSAFLLVAKGKNVDTLKKKFFTDVLFDPAGKHMLWRSFELHQKTYCDAVQLYWLPGDPLEQKNVAHKHGKIVKELSQMLRTEFGIVNVKWKP